MDPIASRDADGDDIGVTAGDGVAGVDDVLLVADPEACAVVAGGSATASPPVHPPSPNTPATTAATAKIPLRMAANLPKSGTPRARFHQSVDKHNEQGPRPGARVTRAA